MFKEMFIDSTLKVFRLRRSVLNVKWRMKLLFVGVNLLEPFDGMQVETFGEVMKLDGLWGRWLPVSKY